MGDPPAPAFGLTSQRPWRGTCAVFIRTAGHGSPASSNNAATLFGERTTASVAGSLPHNGRCRAIWRTNAGRFSRPPVYIQGPAGPCPAARARPYGYSPRGTTTAGQRARKSASPNKSAHHGRSPARRAANAAARTLAPTISKWEIELTAG